MDKLLTLEARVSELDKDKTSLEDKLRTATANYSELELKFKHREAVRAEKVVQSTNRANVDLVMERATDSIDIAPKTHTQRRSMRHDAQPRNLSKRGHSSKTETAERHNIAKTERKQSTQRERQSGLTLRDQGHGIPTRHPMTETSRPNSIQSRGTTDRKNREEKPKEIDRKEREEIIRKRNEEYRRINRSAIRQFEKKRNIEGNNKTTTSDKKNEEKTDQQKTKSAIPNRIPQTTKQRVLIQGSGGK